jgi:hypothetical protein
VSFPVDLTLVQIRDSWLKADGTPENGTVTVTPSVKFRSVSTGVQIAPTSRKFNLDNAGTFSANVPATDDPDYTPSGFTYTVAVALDGWSETYSITVPLASAGTGLDLGLLAPVSSSSGLFVPITDDSILLGI